MTPRRAEGEGKVSEMVKVERVVIGTDGVVYRAPAAQRWLANQKAAGRSVKARLGIAKATGATPTHSKET